MGIAAVAIAATAISGAVAAYGSIKSGEAQQAAANYQAQVANNNARIAQQNATAALSAGAAQQEQNAIQTRAKIGGELAAQAASGLDVNSGTAVNTRSSTAALGEMSGLNIQYNSARQALSYQEQAGSDSAQAQLDKMTGQNAAVAGYIGAGSSLIGGIGGSASELSSLYKTGAIQSPLGMAGGNYDSGVGVG